MRTFRDDVLPVVEVEWVAARRHEEGIIALMAANRRRLSRVDCVSFAPMRERRTRNAFAFDAHFGKQGFEFSQ